MIPIAAGILGLMAAAEVLRAADLVVLQTEEGGETKVVAGDPKLAEREVTPASTFKIVLAWAGLETAQATPETPHRCEDAHVPGTPRELTLKEATFFSSNDYFVWLAKKIGDQKVTQYMRRSGFFADDPPEDWLDGGIASVIRGGKMKVSARQQHAFILRVMRGKVASGPAIQKMLLDCLAWPGEGVEIELYGKTGTYHQTAWFNGFGRQEGKWKAVTVLLKGADARRERAVELFYERWGLKPPDLTVRSPSQNVSG